jgi:hypothetical protein
MRRESSTVVALVGDVTRDLLAGLARSPNVSVASPPAEPVAQPAEVSATSRSSLESAAAAMRAAARHRSMYVIVPADPLADVAASWQHMWTVGGHPRRPPKYHDTRAEEPARLSPGSAGFEISAAEALAAWRAKRFELPDYYLVIAPAHGNGTTPDLYLGPLRAARPRRVAVAGVAESATNGAALLDALRSLEHGPWWPPLDDLLDGARGFYAGGLAETQQRG